MRACGCPKDYLQDDAAPRANAGRFLLERQECRPGRRLKYIVDAFTGQRTALEVLLRSDLSRNRLGALRLDKGKGLLAHLLARLRVLAEIFFQADQDDGDIGTEVVCLLNPLLCFVSRVERGLPERQYLPC